MKKILRLISFSFGLLLSVNQLLAETEPNNYALFANNTTIGTNNNGNIHAATDLVDWWKFEVTGTGKIEIAMTSIIAANVNHFVVECFHHEDTANRVSYAYLTTPTSLVLYVMPGIYYLKFNTYNNEGSYTFNVSFTPSFYNPDAGEQNGKINNATNVTTNPFAGAIGHYCGVIALNNGFDKYDKSDWWTLTTSPGDIYFTINKNLTNSLYIDVYNSTNTQAGAEICKKIISGVDTASMFALKGSGNYKIQVRNESQPGSYQIGYSIKTTNVNNLNSSSNNVLLYPNPTKNSFFISNSSQINLIEVYNIQGEKVLVINNDLKNNNIEVDLHSYCKGLYFVKSYEGNSVINNKILLQ